MRRTLAANKEWGEVCSQTDTITSPRRTALDLAYFVPQFAHTILVFMFVLVFHFSYPRTQSALFQGQFFCFCSVFMFQNLVAITHFAIKTVNHFSYLLE